mmetsp:Transcript_16460/g.27384  ORF Transcript_16460/g.27384 Transcript_16460/m.27384 type:complete len:85 (+) Transcript_16460:268-522(+)
MNVQTLLLDVHDHLELASAAAGTLLRGRLGGSMQIAPGMYPTGTRTLAGRTALAATALAAATAATALAAATTGATSLTLEFRLT